ncbi:hypothetical protein [Haliscomenobacter hydrossis]|uniref:Uncharacterized protein n=1 Tax=Haliscomenobacter hydrossis (strain ATCC 27775 / DSM 1100 / LMG 10767 / O) TaxID=760192 RepID=F4L5R7_HALH1|nr:hypothetical protein [Haliscomenobacter hydrossis]AEE52027.1 hypothetical protein Halhy_4181 [Haliscomenobacter hydrossis DSM 1100]
MDTTTTITVSPSEIEELVAGFKDHSLPSERWTHQAHLIVGLHFAYHFPLDQAIYYLRAGIITYNVATGGKNTHERGYHETITQLWARLLQAYVREKCTGLSLAEACTALLNSPYAEQEIMFRFYSKDCLFSIEARALWVEPDLQPIAC